MSPNDETQPRPTGLRARTLTPRARKERSLVPRCHLEPRAAGEDEDTMKEDRYETIAQALAWARRNGHLVP